MIFSDVDSALAHIESFTNLERTTHYTVRTYRLDRMRALLDLFDHPERAFKTVHIAGSKGKGSTAVFIMSGLKAAGYRTGLYVSPHVTNYRERFTINGSFVDEESLLTTMNSMLEKLEDFFFPEETGYSKPTTFELLTLFGFLVFKDNLCDWAVIETGLGGRLDATNVVVPELSVITPIELEHTAILGDTIAKIAAEKGGIIKENIPTVFGFLKPEAESVIRRIAESRNSSVHSLSEQLVAFLTRTLKEGESCTLGWRGAPQMELLLNLRGSFQAENAALAILCLKILGVFQENLTQSAFQQVFIPGRLEKLQDHPPVFIDGAHTPQSLTKLYDSFYQLYADNGILIFGAVLDKNHNFMAEHSVMRFRRIIISTPGTFKPSDPAALYALFLKKKEELARDCDITLIKDPQLALQKAVDEAASASLPDSPILVTGSFYMAAEIRTLASRKA
jgi:dihydrofolate synthase / folylpolyglutamate synthase